MAQLYITKSNDCAKALLRNMLLPMSAAMATNLFALSGLIYSSRRLQSLGVFEDDLETQALRDSLTTHDQARTNSCQPQPYSADILF